MEHTGLGSLVVDSGVKIVQLVWMVVCLDRAHLFVFIIIEIKFNYN